MKLFKKLNQTGVAHVAALVIVVVGLAAVGTYELVASHAYTPTDSGPSSFDYRWERSSTNIHHNSGYACSAPYYNGSSPDAAWCSASTSASNIMWYGPYLTYAHTYSTCHAYFWYTWTNSSHHQLSSLDSSDQATFQVTNNNGGLVLGKQSTVRTNYAPGSQTDFALSSVRPLNLELRAVNVKSSVGHVLNLVATSLKCS